jgi:hypothetical protein
MRMSDPSVFRTCPTKPNMRMSDPSGFRICTKYEDERPLGVPHLHHQTKYEDERPLSGFRTCTTKPNMRMSDPSGFRTSTTKPNISETQYKDDRQTCFFDSLLCTACAISWSPSKTSGPATSQPDVKRMLHAETMENAEFGTSIRCSIQARA